MKKDELLKLAKENKEVADAIIFITKSAQAATNFDESVPAVGGAIDQQGTGAAPIGQAAPAQAPAGAAAVPADQQALQMAGQGQAVDPAAEGAKAAQAFLAPAFQAAAQGDANAQQTIALAAGQIARGVAEAANEASGGGQQMPPEAASGAPGAPVVPVAPATPESQVADQIVASPVQAKANATPEGEKGQEEQKAEGEGEGTAEAKDKDKKEKDKKKPPFEKKSELMFSADTVHGLIQLAKAGII